MLMVRSVLAPVLCVLLLTFWQSILLLPSWWRRGLWCLLQLAFVFSFYLTDPAKEVIWKATFLTTVIQSLLFLGVRRRFALWAALSVFSYPFGPRVFEMAQNMYSLSLREDSLFALRLPFLLPQFKPVYHMMVGVCIGAIAALLMPPTKPCEPETGR
jgi:hypothetical protein